MQVLSECVADAGADGETWLAEVQATCGESFPLIDPKVNAAGNSDLYDKFCSKCTRAVLSPPRAIKKCAKHAIKDLKKQYDWGCDTEGRGKKNRDGERCFAVRDSVNAASSAKCGWTRDAAGQLVNNGGTFGELLTNCGFDRAVGAASLEPLCGSCMRKMTRGKVGKLTGGEAAFGTARDVLCSKVGGELCAVTVADSGVADATMGNFNAAQMAEVCSTKSAESHVKPCLTHMTNVLSHSIVDSANEGFSACVGAGGAQGVCLEAYTKQVRTERALVAETREVCARQGAEGEFCVPAVAAQLASNAALEICAARFPGTVTPVGETMLETTSCVADDDVIILEEPIVAVEEQQQAVAATAAPTRSRARQSAGGLPAPSTRPPRATSPPPGTRPPRGTPEPTPEPTINCDGVVEDAIAGAGCCVKHMFRSLALPTAVPPPKEYDGNAPCELTYSVEPTEELREECGLAPEIRKRLSVKIAFSKIRGNRKLRRKFRNALRRDVARACGVSEDNIKNDDIVENTELKVQVTGRRMRTLAEESGCEYVFELSVGDQAVADSASAAFDSQAASGDLELESTSALATSDECAGCVAEDDDGSIAVASSSSASAVGASAAALFGAVLAILAA